MGDQPVSAITDHPPSTVTDHTPSAAHGMWSPGESVPQEAEVNFDLIVKHIEELNSLCNQTQIKSTSQGATIKVCDMRTCIESVLLGCSHYRGLTLSLSHCSRMGWCCFRAPSGHTLTLTHISAYKTSLMDTSPLSYSKDTLRVCPCN